ncbi:MAG: hypothetical protein JW969_01450 [Spirochaetales bacterium]|nr:hypothetical protein [Spirochaetales bacterium]
MLGILYLVFCWVSGYLLLRHCLTGFFPLAQIKPLTDKENPVPGAFFYLPASFLIGILFATWLSFLIADILAFSPYAMQLGTWITFGILFLFICFYFLIIDRKQVLGVIEKIKKIPGKKNEILRYLRNYWLEAVLVVFFISISAFLMFTSLFVDQNIINIGFPISGDFVVHLSHTRSFTLGHNFPPEYVYYPVKGINYHFLFDFLIGNLTTLGMRIDWAANLMGILCMTTLLMFIYSLGAMLTGKKAVGALCSLFFLFRSSFAIVTLLARYYVTNTPLSAILQNMDFIGKTARENWGIWTLNLYINQRHLLFGLSILFFIIIAAYPMFRKMVSSLKSEKKTLSGWTSEFILKADNWKVESFKRPVFLALVISLTTYWQGASALAAVFILAVMAIFSKHRLEHLIIGLLTLGISLLILNWLSSPSAMVFRPKIEFGFYAAEKSLFGLLLYYVELMGVLPFVAVCGFIIAPKGMRWLGLAFIVPLCLGSFLLLSRDVLDSSAKFVLVSMLLLHIPAAYFITYIWENKRILLSLRAAAGILIVLFMTATGVVDFITVINTNAPPNRIMINMENPVVKWIRENTEPDAVFLTSPEMQHNALLAGRKIFMGQTYIVYCAGYDQVKRDYATYKMLSARDPYRLYKLAKKYKIDYVYIDELARKFAYYRIDQLLFEIAFKRVYNYSGNMVVIYKRRELPSHLLEILKESSFDKRVDFDFSGITTSPIRSGSPYDLFDGDLKTLVVFDGANPAFIQCELDEPEEVKKVRVFVGEPGREEENAVWWLEAADTVEDMAGQTRTYRLLVGNRLYSGGKWDQVVFPLSVRKKIWRFSVQRNGADNYVHVFDLELDNP